MKEEGSFSFLLVSAISIRHASAPSWSPTLFNESFYITCFPDGSEGKESVCNPGDQGSILWWGRSPGEGNGNPLQYSCLENPMDRGAWWATVHGVTKSGTRLSD